MGVFGCTSSCWWSGYENECVCGILLKLGTTSGYVQALCNFQTPNHFLMGPASDPSALYCHNKINLTVDYAVDFFLRHNKIIFLWRKSMFFVLIGIS